mmetsp:Transcript_16599/g.31370  ORF Transcript_16599/g.31370 Transcript_16599/m.31370 type:complete len:224 (-) Transcript_16599:57-728(-)
MVATRAAVQVFTSLMISAALRHEHDAALTPAGSESGRIFSKTLCCVTPKTAEYNTTSAKFLEDARSVLMDLIFTGGYGDKDTFLSDGKLQLRAIRDCEDALHQGRCPMIADAFFDAWAAIPTEDLVPRFEQFQTKYFFHKDHYFFEAPKCPASFVAVKDIERCSDKFGHFLKLVQLWKEGLKAARKVKQDKGWRGYFKTSEKKDTHYQNYMNIRSQIDALWDE